MAAGRGGPDYKPNTYEAQAGGLLQGAGWQRLLKKTQSQSWKQKQKTLYERVNRKDQTIYKWY